MLYSMSELLISSSETGAFQDMGVNTNHCHFVEKTTKFLVVPAINCAENTEIRYLVCMYSGPVCVVVFYCAVFYMSFSLSS